MSTRCQIEFKHINKYLNRKKPIVERRTVYRHSDGYPESEHGVISDLKKFLKWNSGRNSDIEYQTANFIYWSKRLHEELYFNKNIRGKEENPKLKWSDNNTTNMSSLHTGFGICGNDEFHGDIEYFYQVIYEVIETKKNEFKRKIKIIPYEVKRENWDKPINWDNLVQIKDKVVEISDNYGSSNVISQPSL